MTVKLLDVINAAKPLKKIMDTKFKSFKVIHDLVGLLKEVDEEISFYQTQFRKLRNEYKDNDQAFNDAHATLLNTDINLKSDIVCIKVNDFADANDYPTALEALALEHFIRFE